MNQKGITTPKISLPKGGGANSGIGETFQPNSFSGTGSYSIPIPLTPARGFEPHLSLDYNSGSGNGIFGLGFGISIPKISIRTEKGTPKYDGTDIYTAGTGELVPKEGGSYKKGFLEYHPRIEGSFSSIKHYLDKDKKIDHWEIITSQNETSIFGKTPETRIYNSVDHSQIFEWLIEESTDSKGNKIKYCYEDENNQGLTNKERKKGRSSNNKHIQNIKYGNYIENQIVKFAFEVVFDYGEYTLPTTDNPILETKKSWHYRSDPFSSFKSGFEIRTCRLCQNILVFHHFEQELGKPSLVKSISLNYAPPENYGDVKTFGPSIIKSVTLTGFKRKGEKANDDYQIKSMPPLNFEFSKFSPPKKPKFKKLEIGNNGIPGYLDNSGFMPVDLLGEGISGFLCNDGNSLMYLEPEGDGTYSSPTTPKFFPINTDLKDGSTSLVDLEGNGELELVVNNKTQSGYYQRKEANSWESFQPFEKYPNDFANKDMEMVGLSSNGRTDLFMSGDNELIVYSSLGKEGYTVSDRIEKELGFPSIKKGYKKEHVGFGNILGDGLSHRIKITSNSVECWPSLGYGKFGAKISLGNAPTFDEEFDASRLHLADINGSGTLDLIYVYSDRIELFLNESGNRFTDAIKVELPEPYSNIDRISFSDILGNGTTCLVFTKIAPVPIHYFYDFSGEITIDKKIEKSFKPYLLYQIDNNMGALTQIQYCSSTKFYLEDKKAGKPWITKLPFPVQLVEKTISIDKITGSRFTHCFKYHDGFYDHVEREFRGFGYVETWDTENYPDYQEGTKNSDVKIQKITKENFVPPVYTRTWHHTGAQQEEGVVDQHYKSQYFKGDKNAYDFPKSDLATDKRIKNDPETLRQAYVALHGHVMRTEIYAMDDEKDPGNPYIVTESNVQVHLHQEKKDQKFAVFMVNNMESISYHYERNSEDPRIEQDFTLETDTYGNVLQSCKIFLPRRKNIKSTTPYPDQQKLKKAVLSLSTYVNPIKSSKSKEANLFCHVSCEEQSFELSGLELKEDYFSFDDLKAQIASIGLHKRENIIPYEGEFTGGAQVRQLTWHKHYFWNDDQTDAALLGIISNKALLHHSEEAVFSQKQIEAVYGNKLTDGIHLNHYKEEKSGNQIGGGYDYKDGYWWNPGLVQSYEDELSFYLPKMTTDPFKNETVIFYDKYHLVPTKVIDSHKNKIEEEIDYQTLKPFRIKDINDNLSEVVFDPLGMVIASSIFGKENGIDKGDKPLWIKTNDLLVKYKQKFKVKTASEISEILKSPTDFLNEATSYFYYELGYANNQPPHSINLLRETHVCDLTNETKSNIQVHISYSDGFGRALQTKVKVGKGIAFLRDAEDKLLLDAQENLVTGEVNLRWLTSGRTVYNNKGKAVKKYEPFYSSINGFESERELSEYGVTHVTHYDPLLRVIKVTNPDKSFTSVEFTPWEEKHYDENDNSTDSPFHNTPETHRLDNQGRTFELIQLLETGEQLITQHELDIQGHELSNTDPRGVRCFEHTYDMNGKVLLTKNADAGARWTLNNVMGHPIHTWDSRKFHTKTIYDKLHRPLEIHVKEEDGKELKPYNIIERMIYGDTKPNQEIRNLRGKLVQHYDQAGLVEFHSYDIKGELLKSTRRLRTNYRDEPNWIEGKEEELLEPKQKELKPDDLQTEFVTQWKHDALGRLIQEGHPDGSVSKPEYHPEGWMKKLNVKHKNSIEKEQPFIKNINYNAKGQRTKIRYGNGVTTQYVHDCKTFRLKNLRTIKDDAPSSKLQSDRTPDGCLTRLAPSSVIKHFSKNNHLPSQLQDLHYSYDLVGNITEIRDDAQQTIFFKNHEVSPSATYAYDSIYRLVKATGREHLGQNGSQLPHSYNDAGRVGINSKQRDSKFSPSDGKAMGRYCEQYQYDLSGNMTRMSHFKCSSSTLWTRNYAYNEKGNRLISTKVGGDDASASNLTYDVHGNMKGMQHLSLMKWDHHNQLRATAQQRVNKGTPETTWYVYDAGGQRIRQVTDGYAPEGKALIKKKERIYLGGFEIYREYKSVGTVELERETLHVMDDKQRIAMIETRTKGTDKTPEILIRYQLGNHLDSASLELDDKANIISYEEYTPFGSTSYQAVRSQTEAPKRYRYSGKERDCSTGFYYYGFRYYAPWFGRWMSPDPAGTVDGLNLYRYVKANPIKLIDHLGLQASEGILPKIKGAIATKKADTYFKAGDKMRPKSPTGDKPGFLPKIRQAASDSLYRSGHAIIGRHENNELHETDSGSSFRHIGNMARRAPGPIGNLAGGVTFGIAAYKGHQNVKTLHSFVQDLEKARVSANGRRNANTPETFEAQAALLTQIENRNKNMSDSAATVTPFGRSIRSVFRAGRSAYYTATGGMNTTEALERGFNAAVGRESQYKNKKPSTSKNADSSSPRLRRINQK